MDDDEIILVTQKKSKNNSKNTSKDNSKKSKKVAQKGAASKKSSKKDKNTKTNLWKIKLVLLFLIFIVVAIFMLLSPIFNIKKIQVSGNVALSAESVISLSGIQVETNIFSINKKDIKDKLKEEAYVESSEIVRKFPNTIEINITERKPSFMLQFADSYVYINNQGYMLEITNTPLDLPIIIGIVTDLSNIHPGNRMDIKDLEKMGNAIKIMEIAKSNEINTLITKIDISDKNNYTLILEGERKKAYLGECTELNTRMLLLKKILDLEKGKAGEVFLNVDLNTDDVYFRESVDI